MSDELFPDQEQPDKRPETITEELRRLLEAGASDDRLKVYTKKLQDLMADVEEDLQYTLRDSMIDNLVDFVERMASDAVKALLAGDEVNMRRYLSCQKGGYTGRRSDDPGYIRPRALHEAHPIIHGKLSEGHLLELRRRIVEANAELIRTERLKDLEDQVASLVDQHNRAVAAREEMREKLRRYE